MVRILKALLATAMLGTLLAACGSNGSSSSNTKSTSTTQAGYGSASPTTTTQAPASVKTAAPPVSISGKVNNHGTKSVTGDEIDIEQDNFYFAPTFIKAPAGKTLTVKIHNEGSTSHTFTIDSQHIDVVLTPGEQKTVQVTMPSGGAPLVFFCRFHQSLGMQGAFFAGT